jgi:putative nucleotidyltransferase with HDIG domain
MVESTNVAVDEELWFGSVGDDKELEERAAQSMAAVAARVLGAKPFPAAARKLEELTRDVGTKIEQVVGVLESDPGLSMRLLRLVNSAGYALRVRCTSVRHAAALVGMRRLHQLATTAAVLDLFETDNPAIKSLLAHAAVVGAFCRYLAVHVDLAPDELFTCGFLHDIGKLMMIDAEGEPYLELVRQAGDAPDALHILEQQHFGFDHAVLGAHVLKNWRIPNPVPRVVAWHHNVARAYQADPNTAAMVQTLRLADQLSYLVKNSTEAEAIVLSAQSPAASYLGVSEAQLASMWGDLSRLSQRINSTPGSDTAEIIPREDSIPPAQRKKKKGGKSMTPVRSLPPGTLSAAPEALMEGSLPAPSLEPPRGPISEMPKHFVCVVCQKASYGNRCPVCSGHVCAKHQVGPEQWCTDCAAAYRLDVGSHAFPMWERLTALGIVIGAGMLSVVVAVIAGRPVVGALAGSTLLATLCIVLVLVGRRFWLKRTFLRTRAHAVTPDETSLPLGLSMPPEPAIAMRDEPPLEVRPTVLAKVGELPALFTVAPAQGATQAPPSHAVAPPPPSVAAPAESIAAPPPSVAAPAKMPVFSEPAVSFGEASLPVVSQTRTDPLPPAPVIERFSTAAPAHTLVGLGMPAFADVLAVTPLAQLAAEVAAAPMPAMHAGPTPRAEHDSVLPQATGWRPVERTERPISKSPAELRKLAEVLPSIPPAPELPKLEETPEPEPAMAVAPATMPPARAEAPEPPAPTRPDAAPRPIAPLTNGVAHEPAHTNGVVHEAAHLNGHENGAAPASSPESEPNGSDSAPREESGIFIAAACKAVAPALLVACRPSSLKPKSYACSPMSGT